MSIAPPIDERILADSPPAKRPLWKLYLELAKARLSALVVVTTAAGFVLASDGAIHWARLVWTVIGTALAAAAANALNQCLEVDRDGRMERTRHRPLPCGAMTMRHAYGWSLSVAVLGVAVLALRVNVLTAGLGLMTLLVYIVAYTPLKPRSSLNTLVGAVCGAIPPMMGWTAAAGKLDAGAWVLGAILFVWQIPHFLALAWLYRDDYARGGFRMLPTVDRSGRLTCWVIVGAGLALIPIALSATLVGVAGWMYAAGSLALSGGLLALAVKLYFQRTDTNARRVFLGSLFYVSVLLLLMVADRTTKSESLATTFSDVGIMSP